MARPKPPASTRRVRPHRPPGGRRRTARTSHPTGAHRGIDWGSLTVIDWATTNATLGARLGVSPSFVSRQRRRYGVPQLATVRAALVEGRLGIVSDRDRRVRRREGSQGRRRALTMQRYLEARDQLTADGRAANDCAVRRALAETGLRVSRTTVRQRRLEAEAAFQGRPAPALGPSVAEVFEKAGWPTSIARSDVRAQFLSDRRAHWWLRRQVEAELLVPFRNTRRRRYLDAATARLLDVELDVIDALLDFGDQPSDGAFDHVQVVMLEWAERAERGGLDGLAERAEAVDILVGDAIAELRAWPTRPGPDRTQA